MVNEYKNLFLMDPSVTYLNCANMGPLLKTAKEAGLQSLETRAAPWKLTASDWFTDAEILRELAAEVYQTHSNNIALIPSASYGLAIAAKNFNLPAGKEIVILKDEFPSNYYVWENLCRQQNLQLIMVDEEENKSLTDSIVEKINSNTGIIAIPNCHWKKGTLINLKQVSDAAKTFNAYLVLDLSQSLGALPINMEKIQPDFAVSVGYKWLLGPYSLAYLYASPYWQQHGEPLEYNWIARDGSDDFASLTNYALAYRAGARKFDMGENSQFNSLPMAIAGLQQINSWGIPFIQSTIKKYTDKIIDFKKTNGLEKNPALNAGHIISIPLNNLNAEKLKDRLQKNKVIISFRAGNSIRVAPHLYNDMADIDKLLSCFDN